VARKSADIFNGKSDALIAFESVTAVQYETAKEAYDAQDEETQAALDVIVSTLRTYVEPVTKMGIPIDEDVLDQCLLVMAMQTASDMALLDVNIGNYVFPANLCASCGSDV
jgi:hypothetical protein